MRIDAELNAGSRMGHTLRLGLVDFTDNLIIPAPSEQELKIEGLPEGSWINLISWSDDSKYIAFTIRSAGNGNTAGLACVLPVILRYWADARQLSLLDTAFCINFLAIFLQEITNGGSRGIFHARFYFLPDCLSASERLWLPHELKSDHIDFINMSDVR